MSGAAFPFDLLHAEIVKYAKEQDETRKRAKSEFLKSVEPVNVDNVSHLLQQAFSQKNAETKIENMGFRVGYVLSEKISKDTGRLSTELEVVKFICKEFWSAAFGKQVDNLRTNHQGVYVVQDNKMCVLLSFSEGTQFLEHTGIYLSLPSGIIRGALANLGIQAVVTPTVETLPSPSPDKFIRQFQRVLLEMPQEVFDELIPGYTVDNTEDTRTIMLSTVKKLLSLPKTRVFLDLQVNFRHRDVLTTEVMSKMTLVKGPQDAEYPTKRERRQVVKAEKKAQKKKGKLASLKADKRIIQGTEIYPVHNWVPRNQLNEEEPAIYEVGVRDDPTSKDTISWEITKSRDPGNKEMTFLEKIKAVEGGYELRNSPSCEDLTKENKKEPSKQKFVSVEKKSKKEESEEMEKQAELVQPVGEKKVEKPSKEEKIEPQLKSKRILYPEPLVKKEKAEEPQPVIEKRIEEPLPSPKKMKKEKVKEEPLPELSRLKSPEVLDKKEQTFEKKKENTSGWMEMSPGPKGKTQVTMTVRVSK